MRPRATRQTAQRGFCGDGNRRLYALAIRAGLTVVDLRALRSDAAGKNRNIRGASSPI